MKIRYIITAIVMGFILGGCTKSAQPNREKILNVKVIAGKTSTPLSIHFFTLKSDNVFKRLDYFELVDSKHIQWNGELLSRAKTLLLPGHTEIFQVPVSDQMQYYALVIGFKDVRDNDNWRYLKPVPSHGDNIALRLSQESNGYTSRVVERVSQSEAKSTQNSAQSHVNKIGKKIGDKVANKVEDTENRAIDRTVDKVLGNIFH